MEEKKEIDFYDLFILKNWDIDILNRIVLDEENIILLVEQQNEYKK